MSFEEEEATRLARAMIKALKQAEEEARLEAIASAPPFGLGASVKLYAEPWWKSMLRGHELSIAIRIAQTALLGLLVWRLW